MSSQTTAVRPAPDRRRAGWHPSRLTVARNCEIAVFEAGRTERDAPTIVFVHGMGHWTQAAWDFVAAEFEATHRLVAFDLPGFGASEKPRVAYTLEFFASVLGETIAAYVGDRVTLVGHSLGALVAATYAAREPARVGLLVLVGPAGFLRTPALVLKIAGSRPVRWLFGKIEPSPKFVRKTFENAVFDRRAIPEDYLDRAVVLSRDPALVRAFADVYANALGAFVNLRALHARLARYRGPVLLVWGREDRFVPVKGLRTAREVYPHATALVLERCGHCPSIEEPDALVAAMRASGA